MQKRCDYRVKALRLPCKSKAFAPQSQRFFIILTISVLQKRKTEAGIGQNRTTRLWCLFSSRPTTALIYGTTNWTP